MTNIAGRYALEEKIGEGALAVVWRGRSTGSGGFTRRVAAKQLRPELAADEAFIASLSKGASDLMASPRPYVEGILDIVREGSDCYVMTDFIDGPSLKRWAEAYHARNEPAPWGQLLAIGASVLFGLHALHTRAQPLVHGAIGSTSIRLDRSGFPLVTRFGVRTALAAAKADVARAKNDALWMDAPEGQLSASSDVFAVGLVLYAILAGATDITDLPADLQARLLAGKPVDLNLIRKELPAVVLRTIERALRPDPRERFESAISMARSLELVLRSLAEINDPLSLSHAIETVLPRGKPAAPRRPPEAKPTPAMPMPAQEVKAAPAKLGIKKEATDQLDLNELRRLRIDEE